MCQERVRWFLEMRPLGNPDGDYHGRARHFCALVSSRTSRPSATTLPTAGSCKSKQYAIFPQCRHRLFSVRCRRYLLACGQARLAGMPILRSTTRGYSRPSSHPGPLINSFRDSWQQPLDISPLPAVRDLRLQSPSVGPRCSLIDRIFGRIFMLAASLQVHPLT